MLDHVDDKVPLRRDSRIRVGPGAAQVLDRGPQDAPTVLLLHGLGSIAEEILTGLGPPLLKSGFRVIAVDRPGYGCSDALGGARSGPAAQADWLTSVLRALDLSVDIVVAHSFGAAVALCWSWRAAPRPDAIVLVNPFCKPTPPAAAPLMRLSVVPAIGPFVRRTVIPAIASPLVRAMVANACAPDPVPRTLKGLRPHILAKESAIMAMASELRDFNDDVAGLRAPSQGSVPRLLALSGAADRVIAGRAHAEWLQAMAPGVEHRCVDGGHMLHHVRPKVVVRAVQALSAGPLASATGDDGAWSKSRNTCPPGGFSRHSQPRRPRCKPPTNAPSRC